MVEDEHEAEDLVEFLGRVGVVAVLEERDEHVGLPVVVEPSLLLEDLVDADDAGGGEASQPILHQSQHLLLHLSRKELLCARVVAQEQLLELVRLNVVEHVFDDRVHFAPEVGTVALQSLHQVVHVQVVFLLNATEVAGHVLEGLGDPRVAIPVVLLLPGHL